MKKAILLFIFLLSSLQLYSQTENGKDYQRYDLVIEELELRTEGQLRYWFENVEDKTLFSIMPLCSAEFIFMKHHSIKAVTAYTFSFYDNHEARKNIFYAPNDINLSYEYNKQIKHYNLYFGPQVSIPLGITNEYSVREGILIAGAGRYTAGGTFAITGVRDPVVWNGEIKYDIGLPKHERYGTTWLPGILHVTFGFTDLVNDMFGFSFGLQQQIVFPKILNDTPVPDSLSFTVNGQLEIFVLFEHDYFRAAFIAAAYPLNRPHILTITYGHVFKNFKKKKQIENQDKN